MAEQCVAVLYKTVCVYTLALCCEDSQNLDLCAQITPVWSLVVPNVGQINYRDI